jgi:hypothetical protein
VITLWKYENPKFIESGLLHKYVGERSSGSKSTAHGRWAAGLEVGVDNTIRSFKQDGDISLYTLQYYYNNKGCAKDTNLCPNMRSWMLRSPKWSNDSGISTGVAHWKE